MSKQSLENIFRSAQQLAEADPEWLRMIPCVVKIEPTDSTQRWTFAGAAKSGELVVRGSCDDLASVFTGVLSPQVAFAQERLRLEGSFDDQLWFNVFFRQMETVP